MSDTGDGSKPDRRRAEHALTRLEAVSDGVFAIAATLLVLDLVVSELGQVSTDAGLWDALVELTPSFVAFVVSFLLLCLLWWLHVRTVEDIVRVDRVFVALNCLRLLGVVLIPFTTSINSTFTELTAREARAVRRDGLAAVLLSAAALLLSPFVGSLAFLVFELDPLVSRWLRRGAAARPMKG